MPHLNADEVAPTPSMEPIGFTLGGADFACIPFVPAGRAAMLRDHMAGGERGALEVVVDFVADVVDPQDRDRFAERILDTDDPVDPTKIVAVYLWLCSVYAERANPDDGTATVPATPPPSPMEPDGRRVDAILRMGGQIA